MTLIFSLSYLTLRQLLSVVTIEDDFVRTGERRLNTIQETLNVNFGGPSAGWGGVFRYYGQDYWFLRIEAAKHKFAVKTRGREVGRITLPTDWSIWGTHCVVCKKFFEIKMILQAPIGVTSVSRRCNEHKARGVPVAQNFRYLPSNTMDRLDMQKKSRKAMLRYGRVRTGFSQKAYDAVLVAVEHIFHLRGADGLSTTNLVEGALAALKAKPPEPDMSGLVLKRLGLNAKSRAAALTTVSTSMRILMRDGRVHRTGKGRASRWHLGKGAEV